ncbi:Biotin synthase [Propionispora sp. 2/2-37]|uniref:biotin synthase BioB n=1 Tax=Propionispora sp. 2/2-37 TaxID=1677858 RepID=UPI0006BB80F4|nr:biotin synthase BioB [Propionispora sp. 2/2-37]CUH95057.1 Biotin synthase [Propionispora sp. 2/2-37]
MKLCDLFTMAQAVLDGKELSFDDALALTRLAEDDIPVLLSLANKIRIHFTGSIVDTCEIINARSGNCSEDCKFCAQSAHHQTQLAVYPLMSEQAMLAAAKQAEADGAYRFCIVTSGCGMKNDADFPSITQTIRRIGQETALQRCCSLGILDEQHVAELKQAGITRYHHNLEAGKSFFGRICSTHSYENRVATIKKVKAAGLEVCSGGIIGLGESWEHRLELAFALKELDVDSVPINVLNPIKGTPVENMPPLKPMEILQTFAIFRFILPGKIIRYAGGRERNLGELVPLGFLSGINGMLIGNYLTTSGRGAETDLNTITQLGLAPIGKSNLPG